MTDDKRSSNPNPVRCFHVEAGKPCTRYLEGSEGERASIVAWLRREMNESNYQPRQSALKQAADDIEKGEHGRPPHDLCSSEAPVASKHTCPDKTPYWQDCAECMRLFTDRYMTPEQRTNDAPSDSDDQLATSLVLRQALARGESRAEVLARFGVRVDNPNAARCFHVDAGKRCTRYAEGADGEHQEIMKWLRSQASQRAGDMRESALITRLIDDLEKGRRPNLDAPATDYVPVAKVLAICEEERLYWTRRCEGGDLPLSPNDASDGWAASENIAQAVAKLIAPCSANPLATEGKS